MPVFGFKEQLRASPDGDVITGKPSYSWRGFSDTFINPNPSRVLSSPDESGVTSKTPRNPRLEGEEGVSGTSMMYVLPPGEYLVAYARYITPLCEEALACSLQIYISKHGLDAAKSVRLDSVTDLALLDIYPVEAIIKKFKVLDADHAEVTDTWTCHGNECEEILYAINRMRGIP